SGAVRRPAAARRDRARTDERPAVPARRRGDRQPRQQDRGGDPAPARRAAPRRGDDRHRHAQPQGRRARAEGRVVEGRPDRARGDQPMILGSGRLAAALRTFRLGIKSLALHKLRSALTMLGMLFGVFSVIAMLAIGEGASYEAQQQIKALGSTNIIVRTVKPPETEQVSSGSMWTARFYGIKYRDAERIADTLQNLELVVPVRWTRRDARVGASWYPTDVVGTIPEFANVASIQVAEGRWLTSVDEHRQSNVAVLGSLAA